MIVTVIFMTHAHNLIYFLDVRNFPYLLICQKIILLFLSWLLRGLRLFKACRLQLVLNLKERFSGSPWMTAGLPYCNRIQGSLREEEYLELWTVIWWLLVLKVLPTCRHGWCRGSIAGRAPSQGPCLRYWHEPQGTPTLPSGPIPYRFPEVLLNCECTEAGADKPTVSSASSGLSWVRQT